MTIPGYTIADMPSGEREALNTLMQGRDLSGYKDASDYLSNLGTGLVSSGQSGLASSQSVLNKLQNMSQSDYQGMIKSEYNSDLVNSQVSQLKTDVNDQISAGVHSLNQNATASGNMGSSRAGVAEGSLRASGAKALASGIVQYQTAEESAATSRLNSYLGLQTNAATANAQIASNQLSTGLSSYGQGLNAYNAYQTAQLQDLSNAVTAGSQLQSYNQSVADTNRINSILSQSPTLNALSYYSSSLGSLAGWNQSSSGTQTNTQSGGGSSFLGGLISTAANSYIGNKASLM